MDWRCPRIRRGRRHADHQRHGIAPTSRGLLLDAQTGFAFVVDTTQAKEFALAHWLVNGADGGRLFVRCFDGDGCALTDAKGQSAPCAAVEFDPGSNHERGNAAQPFAHRAGFAAAGGAPSATSTSCAALKASSPAGMPQ